MTSAISTSISWVTVMWLDLVVWLSSDGQAKRLNPYLWESDCTSDRTELEADSPCDDAGCPTCYRPWQPGYEYPRQGTMQEAHQAELNNLRWELAEAKRVIEQDMISIETVQRVGHDYSVQQEWCSVYEEAFTKLTTDHYPNGIPVLDSTSYVEMTVTFRGTVRAARRQRIGNTDHMRQSIMSWRIQDHVDSMDPFDSDYTVESGWTVDRVDIDIVE